MALGRTFPVPIEGMIMGAQFQKAPEGQQNGKDKIVIQVAKNVDGLAHIIEIRDFDITNLGSYELFTQFKKDVMFNEWSMGNRSGTNWTVINDKMVITDYELQSPTKSSSDTTSTGKGDASPTVKKS